MEACCCFNVIGGDICDYYLRLIARQNTQIIPLITKHLRVKTLWKDCVQSFQEFTMKLN